MQFIFFGDTFFPSCPFFGVVLSLLLPLWDLTSTVPTAFRKHRVSGLQLVIGVFPTSYLLRRVWCGGVSSSSCLDLGRAWGYFYMFSNMPLHLPLYSFVYSSTLYLILLYAMPFMCVTYLFFVLFVILRPGLPSSQVCTALADCWRAP